MAESFDLITGGDISMEPASTTKRYRYVGPPDSWSGDMFDYVASYALANVSLTHSHPLGTLYRQDIQIHENHYARSYEITVPYGPRKKASGAYQISVRLGGGMVHIVAGRRISGYGLPDANKTVDNGGLIGVEAGEVRGADIPIESMSISVSFRHPEGVLNSAYIRAIGKIVGYPNSDSFLGFSAGEVLYSGGNLTESETEATANYDYTISPNRTAFEVAGITIATKKGWDIISPNIIKEENGGVPIKKVDYIEIIRPREWVPYASTFGWGG